MRARPERALLLAACMLGACQFAPALPDDAAAPIAPIPAETPASPEPAAIADTDAAPVYPSLEEALQFLLQLQDATVTERKSKIRELTRLHRDDPAPANKLRLALALSVPTNGDLGRARRLMSDLRATWPVLPLGLEALLRLRLAAMNLHAAHDEQLSTLLKEQETLKAEHEALRLELEDAQAKLKALTEIEQKIETPEPAVPPP